MIFQNLFEIFLLSSGKCFTKVQVLMFMKACVVTEWYALQCS